MATRFCDAHYWMPGQPCPVCELAYARQQDAALLERCVAVISDIGLVEPSAKNCGFGDHEIENLLADIAARKAGA